MAITATNEEAGRRRFVESSRRMARSIERIAPADRPDPGDTLQIAREAAP
jgi:hypothetical protein